MDVDKLFERFATEYNRHARSRGLAAYPIGAAQRITLKELLRGAPVPMAPEVAERFKADFFKSLLADAFLGLRSPKRIRQQKRFIDEGVTAQKLVGSNNRTQVIDAALEVLQTIKSGKLPSDRWLAKKIHDRTEIKLGTVRGILIALNKG